MNATRQNRFESRAKLMLSGEYLVLKGALALALPLRFGQILTVTDHPGRPIIKWNSFINNQLWFSAILDYENFTVAETSHPDLAETLCRILSAAKELQPEFLDTVREYHATSAMDFEPGWGIGSSSSLIANIAGWAKCDPFSLNNKIFNGSGYDIACAGSVYPITYKLSNHQPSYREAGFHPSFHRQLWFIHLNRKQNSRESVSQTDLRHIPYESIQNISALTLSMIKADDLRIFEAIMDQHEEIVGSTIHQIPVMEQYFNDFRGSIKSLGAWGGDFILAASSGSEDYVRNYFIKKGLSTIFSYDDIVFKNSPPINDKHEQ
jgi:mevalonate kinase